MTEENNSEKLIAPIEDGKTFHMPETPTEGQEVFKDNFKLKCEHIDLQPKSIVLPKFVFNMGVGFKEKSFLLLGFASDHKNQLFSKILTASSKGFKKFHIEFLDEEDGSVVSTWKFAEARIQAVDFGYVANERSTPTEIAVEVDFKHLEIGEVSI